MSRYIDADRLQQTYKEIHGGKRSLLIDTEPTAEVVEVVRCKDCVYRPCLIMPHSYDFDFCSYGERADA